MSDTQGCHSILHPEIVASKAPDSEWWIAHARCEAFAHHTVIRYGRSEAMALGLAGAALFNRLAYAATLSSAIADGDIRGEDAREMVEDRFPAQFDRRAEW